MQLRFEMITDNPAVIGEPISERDQELQFLSGLGVEYNPIVASITAREYDLPLQSVHSILLTHEQRLHVQNTIPKKELILAHLATQSWPT